jgi:hypothetical protein
MFSTVEVRQQTSTATQFIIQTIVDLNYAHESRLTQIHNSCNTLDQLVAVDFTILILPIVEVISNQIIENLQYLLQLYPSAADQKKFSSMLSSIQTLDKYISHICDNQANETSIHLPSSIEQIQKDLYSTPPWVSAMIFESRSKGKRVRHNRIFLLNL